LVAAEVERLARRETELASQLADIAAIRDTLDRQLTDNSIALKNADERATAETRRCETLECEIAETREHAARLEDQRARERFDQERRLAEIGTSGISLETERAPWIARRESRTIAAMPTPNIWRSASASGEPA
jgi:hypothetical protein